MKNEFMNHDSIKAYLESQGLKPEAKQDKSQLMISKKVIRCESGNTMIVGMGNDYSKDDQIHLVVDAVHLCNQAKSKKKNLRLIFGRREDKDDQAEVENAVALMIESKRIPLKIEIEVDGKIANIKSQSFDKDPKGKIGRWMQYLSRKPKIPEFAENLEKAIHDDIFKWYQSVTRKSWSGRVGGLEVCTIEPTGQKGELKVGKRGKNDDGEARKVFLKILKKENIKEGPFFRPQLDKIASVIRIIAKSKKNGELNEFQREHLLESYVLSGKLQIDSKLGILKPVVEDHPFQFPTLWSPSANPRYVDALMRFGNIPYVLELKEPEGFKLGQYYRHAITQAVLYREFIRRTKKIHPWFTNKGLDPIKCRAVVAFPELLTKNDEKNQMLLSQHTRVAKAFDVEVVEINATGL